MITLEIEEKSGECEIGEPPRAAAPFSLPPGPASDATTALWRRLFVVFIVKRTFMTATTGPDVCSCVRRDPGAAGARGQVRRRAGVSTAEAAAGGEVSSARRARHGTARHPTPACVCVCVGRRGAGVLLREREGVGGSTAGRGAGGAVWRGGCYLQARLVEAVRR